MEKNNSYNGKTFHCALLYRGAVSHCFGVIGEKFLMQNKTTLSIKLLTEGKGFEKVPF